MAAPQALPFERETQLAKQFVEQFYATFDSNRMNLTNVYRDMSQISFEGATVQGANAFIQRIEQLQLPPNQRHRPVTIDAQPSVAGSGAVLVCVTGEYCQQQYSEIFHLVDQGGLFVFNDIFRVGNTNAFNVPEAAAQVSKQFIEYYYTTYDKNRPALIQLYRPQSCFTQERARLQGAQQILEHLNNLPGVEHDPSSITADVQQVNGVALLLIFITGKLRLEGESNALNFTETFQLVQDGASYYIGNHFFMLKYG